MYITLNFKILYNVSKTFTIVRLNRSELSKTNRKYVTISFTFYCSFHGDLFKKEKPYGSSVNGPHTKTRARVLMFMYVGSSAGSNATALSWFSK
jgi:hypothetical protein